MRKKFTGIVFPILFFILLAVQVIPFMGEEDTNYRKYLKAARLETEGNFDEAIIVLKELGEYKDAAERKKDATYLKAIQYMEQAKYDEAIRIFLENLSLYDCPEKLDECRYNLGYKEMEAKNYEKAAEYFKLIGEDEATDLYIECLYLYAEQCVEAGGLENLLKAATTFIMIEDNKEDAGIRLVDVRYQIGMLYREQGDYQNEISYLKKVIDYKDSKEILYADMYQYAGTLFAEQNYEKAVEIYSELAVDNYLDSVALAKECIYQNALLSYDTQSMSAGKAEKLLEIFESLGDYKDSVSCANECRKVIKYGTEYEPNYANILRISNAAASYNTYGEGLKITYTISNNTEYEWTDIRVVTSAWYHYGDGSSVKSEVGSTWEKITLSPGESRSIEAIIGIMNSDKRSNYKKNGYITVEVGKTIGEGYGRASMTSIYEIKYSRVERQ